MSRFAYISQGRLYYKDGDKPAAEIVSEYGRQVVDRAMRIQQSLEWKTSGPGARFTGAAMAAHGPDPRAMRVAINAACRGAAEGELLYALDTDQVGGLFSYELGPGHEKRLFHRAGFLVGDLARHPDRDLMAFSLAFDNGTANIVIARSDGGAQSTVTEGDSFDCAPSWSPGEEKSIIYQSAGVARNGQGFPVGLGPFIIHKIEVDQGRLTTLREEPGQDLLCPRGASGGAVYFIRRPYEGPGHRRVNPWRVVTDFLLFPFRLARALFHFLNFFSMTFSRKPLTTAGTPRPEMDAQKMVLWGKVIEADKLLKKAGKGEDAPSLVPDSWELVRADAGGACEVVARSVLAYDLAPDDSIIHTNGSAVFRLDPAGKNEKLHRASLIEKVVAL